MPTTYLELEVVYAVNRHHHAQGFGQAVADTRAFGLVVGFNRVDLADGVARGDARRGLEGGQEGAEVDAAQVFGRHRGMQAEGGTGGARSRIRLCSQRHGAAQLIEMVFVAQRGRLVEPFRRQQLGGHARAFAAVVGTNAHRHEDLRRLAQRDHAKTTMHAQAHLAFEEAGRPQLQPRGGFTHRGGPINARM